MAQSNQATVSQCRPHPKCKRRPGNCLVVGIYYRRELEEECFQAPTRITKTRSSGSFAAKIFTLIVAEVHGPTTNT
jgi:hypothetical protein